MKTLVFTFSLALGFAPTLLHAQQLRQPDSVLPWKPRSMQLRIAQASPAKPLVKMAPEVNETPNWLLESAKQLPRQASPHRDLPMVEAEGFVDLGELEVSNMPAPRQSAQRNSTTGEQSFDILRAFGIRSAEPQ